jgi:glycosyltransferase involved in cell wall biosynthesis
LGEIEVAVWQISTPKWRIARLARSAASGALHTARQGLLQILARSGRKTISAMMRVRNEQEFLEPAVLSIIDLVDEVVIVDNMSNDSTPEIIARLVRNHPEKIRTFSYPHRLARYGEETRSLASTPDGLRSPTLLANFYNYCLSLCRYNYVLKWDGDTVATPALSAALARFRRSSAQVLWHTGANLHANGKDLIAGRPHEDMEPRLFRKLLARYDNALGYCETLQSPFLVDPPRGHAERCSDPLYVHMKFCKSDRFANLSEDLQQAEWKNDRPGAAAGDDLLETVARWGLRFSGE